MDLGALIILGFIGFAGYWIYKNYKEYGFKITKYK